MANSTSPGARSTFAAGESGAMSTAMTPAPVVFHKTPSSTVRDVARVMILAVPRQRSPATTTIGSAGRNHGRPSWALNNDEIQRMERDIQSNGAQIDVKKWGGATPPHCVRFGHVAPPCANVVRSEP